MKHALEIDLSVSPDILLIGNGVLRLGESMSWDELLQKIVTQPEREYNLDNVPLAMKPECVCGVDVDEVQRRTAEAIRESNRDASHYLERLVALPFDAIMTTNYTYEIEQALTGNKWTEQVRRKAFTALDGNNHVRNNTCVCNMVKTEDGRTVPVFHIHGEKQRKHSLILSYYSYANAVSRLITLNKQRGNSYLEKQTAGEKMPCISWLDYFLMGNVYSVGFGFDTSEFDIWWAVERKAREKAKHGELHAYMVETEDRLTPQKALFEAMKVHLHQYVVSCGQYLEGYERALKDIEAQIQKRRLA